MTREEVEKLKADWRGDPCWDIATTEGFEEHKEELTAYQVEQEKRWADAQRAVLSARAEALGCPGNLKLAACILVLEERLSKLEGKG